MKCLAAAMLLMICSPSVLAATTTINYWNFFTGGDGVRMKQIVRDFNKNQSSVQVNSTTLKWGTPFYTKLHSAVASGNAPDVVSYHLSHFPTGIEAGDLHPIKQQELDEAGIPTAKFLKTLIHKSLSDSKQYGKADRLYGVPLDTHTLVLYYNKSVLRKAGVLGKSDQLKIQGIDQFDQILKKVKKQTSVFPLSFASNDNATVWRTWYTLFKQQNGTLEKDGDLSLNDMQTAGLKSLSAIVNWTKRDYTSGGHTSYPAMVALFTGGRAAFMINGDWEVPTLADRKQQHALGFDYGIMAFPQLYKNRNTWADSHNLAIPAQKKGTMSPAKHKAALEFIHYVEKHAFIWAGGGHIPAYQPVRNSKKYKQMVPNNEYSVQAAQDVVFSPSLPIFGVADPAYIAVKNFFVPAIAGQMSPEAALKQFQQSLLKAAQN